MVLAAVAAESQGVLWTLARMSAAATEPTANPLSGQARIVDGDTLAIGNVRIRLWGIDAPESRQTCEGKAGDVYECGRDATAALREVIAGRPIECTERDRDQYSRVVAICRTEAGEVNAAMVRRGWAVDYRRYSGGAYGTEEAAAKAEGLGIWSGRFELPSRWRQEHPH